MGPLAEAELDAERAPRDRDLVAVFGRVEAVGLPAARSDPVVARAVRAELHSAARGLDRHLDAERSRDVHGTRAALDPDRQRALGRPQGDLDAARARLAVEAADGGGGEVEVATAGPRGAARLPTRRPDCGPTTCSSAPAAAHDEPDAESDQDDRPEDVRAQPVEKTDVAQQEVESHQDQHARPEIFVPPVLLQGCFTGASLLRSV